MMRRFLSCRRGAAAVEAGLAMPLLFAIGLGAADAANLFSETHRMKAGLAAGARYLAKARDPVASQSAAVNIAVTDLRTTGGTPRVNGWTAADVTVTYRLVDNSAGAYTAGDDVRVIRFETARPYDGFGLLALLGVGTVQVSAAHEERWTGS